MAVLRGICGSGLLLRDPARGSSAFLGVPVVAARSSRVSKVRGGGIRAVKTEKVGADYVEILPSGEWPENFSMLNFEDLSLHFAPTLFKAEAQPSTLLADVMSGLRFSAAQDDLLEAIEHCFDEVSGVPVLDEERKCIGVVSRKDRDKATNGLKSPVSEVMSSPAITLSADKTVSDAAVIMLKKKIHRIPIVNDSNAVIGMVTRTDIFTALEGKHE
ncbi:uncharacterized protein LOC9660199 [Selaginella moellendorffii]|uniref:uncharacterized protein LOC9660199 n=1 Tax=Selaginella moellendorffii TaxID=88036 RepID=UPI000D1CF52B|nr:uncharacterized protein LOC9660199 [Selaginella moellendorffii]|eukprot:XP_002965195.2 uncharacterized protein LOC9660199 [Selaginella moellendorffii]